jgi:Kef-type K+ transport system membrane component KefB
MRTGSIAKYGLAFVLSGVSIGLMWLGANVLEDAARRASSTFEIPREGLLLHAGLSALAGAVFAPILMIRAKRDRRFGYLVAAAVIPAIVATLPFLFLWNVLEFGGTWFRWTFSPEIRAVSAFAVGALLAHILWRAIGPTRPEEPS